jgi:hypothetical protein
VAFGNTIVVPNVNASVVGNDMDASDGSGDFRSQELLGAAQFAAVSGPILIDQLSLRAVPGTGPLDFTMASLDLYLSTSPKFPNASGPLMSDTFADNVGPDNTLVFSGLFTASSPGCAGPGVCPFDTNITFTTPFLYNPANGRLLLDLKVTGYSGVDGETDAVLFAGPNGGSVANVVGSLNDTSGGLTFGGDIFQLRYTAAAPEPAPAALMFIGVAALALVRRHRSSRA